MSSSDAEKTKVDVILGLKTTVVVMARSDVSLQQYCSRGSSVVD